jgi:hypothetical protein
VHTCQPGDAAIRQTDGVSVDKSLSAEEYGRWWNEAGFAEVKQLLFWRWDPIGVGDAFPVTADEYDRYARVLLSRLRAGATAGQVAEYLLDVERSSMGQRFSDDAKLREVGERVIAWFEESIPHWMDRRG